MSDASLLTLTQWLSPAFPVGGFAYSHGLEWAVSNGDIATAADLRNWLEDTLEQGAGRTDAILLACALRGAPEPEALSDLARALAPSRERLVETLDQGRAFLAATNALRGTDWPAMPYPVALGVAARPLGLEVAQVVALYLHAFASNLVQAGVRFVPLGQTEGQAVLGGLHPLILTLARTAATAGVGQIGTATLRGDLAAMHHETMDVRIFRT